MNRGTLIRWTKGFDIPDTVDRDVVELLQANLTILEVNVKVVAIANDTVGTLLTAAYSMTQQRQTETQSLAVFLVQELMVLISSQKFPNYPVRLAKAKVWSSTQNGVHLTTA